MFRYELQLNEATFKIRAAHSSTMSGKNVLPYMVEEHKRLSLQWQNS